MSLIHLYLDKNNNSNSKLIELFRNHNIDFLQHNIENNEINLKSYDIKNIPAAKFEKSTIYDINEKSIETLIEEFNNFVETIPCTTTSNPKLQNPPEENKEDKNQILMDTLKVSDKQKLSNQIKAFSDRHKK